MSRNRSAVSPGCSGASGPSGPAQSPGTRRARCRRRRQAVSIASVADSPGPCPALDIWRPGRVWLCQYRCRRVRASDLWSLAPRAARTLSPSAGTVLAHTRRDMSGMSMCASALLRRSRSESASSVALALARRLDQTGSRELSIKWPGTGGAPLQSGSVARLPSAMSEFAHGGGSASVRSAAIGPFGASAPSGTAGLPALPAGGWSGGGPSVTGCLHPGHMPPGGFGEVNANIRPPKKHLGQW